MKIKNTEVISMLNNLSKYKDTKLPQKISYAITKNNIILSKEYEYYESEINKIKELYSNHMFKDKNGETEMYSNGIPRLDDDTLEKEMIHRINELLLIENDIDMHIIDEDCFNYDDCNGKYDVLSPIEIMNLQRILCGVGMNE